MKARNSIQGIALVIFLSLITTVSKGQDVHITVSHITDTVIVGENTYVERVTVSSDYCKIDPAYTQLYFYPNNGWTLVAGPEDYQFSLLATKPGAAFERLKISFGFYGKRGCPAGEDDYFNLSAFAILDSIVHVYLPKTVLSFEAYKSMFVDSILYQFDNNISDTTLFSNFTAIPTNGASLTLQVFDSIAPITQYRAIPFARKKQLNLVFSSPNYKSFDTVIFSTRIRHHNVDSVISYRLPVTWAPLLSVSQAGNRAAASYCLPNPFTDHASIGFQLEKAEPVRVELYDELGRLVKLVEEPMMEMGMREVELPTSDLPAESYYYSIRGGEWRRSGKTLKSAR